MGGSRSSHEATPTAHAAIFDLDGLLVDTEPVHMQTWRIVMGRRGVSVTDDVLRSIVGVSDALFIEEFIAEHDLAGSPAEWLADKRATYLELIRDGVNAFPGAVELVRGIAGRVPVAIATSAGTKDVDVCAGRLGIADLLATVVAKEDVPRHKPSPDCFLLAAERMGVEPAGCVVFEDSLAGVEAARRAAMRCVAVTNSFTAEELADADLVVDNLAEAERILAFVFEGGSHDTT